MVHLLDVNVLIALIDEDHDLHDRAIAWFSRDPQRAWATCPITENGFVRIIGHRNYPGFQGGTKAARQILELLCQLPVINSGPTVCRCAITNGLSACRIRATSRITICWLWLSRAKDALPRWIKRWTLLLFAAEAGRFF